MNTSGIEPVDVKCLVLPDLPKTETKGGIIIPETTKEKEKYAAVKATLIAVGPSAFMDWAVDGKPKAGDRIMMAQYAGANVKGVDEKDYRIINDEDIVSILTVENV